MTLKKFVDFVEIMKGWLLRTAGRKYSRGEDSAGDSSIVNADS